MLRRERIVYSVFLFVTVVLASTIVFTYKEQQRSAELESYQTISQVANSINEIIYDMTSRFSGAYSKMRDDAYSVRNGNISNETRIQLLYRTLYIYFPTGYNLQIENVANRIWSLANDLGEQAKPAMSNVSVSIKYAIDQIPFVWGREPDDTYRLISELYNIFGVNSGGENQTGLEGIAHSFDAISSQYNALAFPQTYPDPQLIQLSTMLDWAAGNATQMYQALLVWHENNPR